MGQQLLATVMATVYVGVSIHKADVYKLYL